ncbi:MAG: family 16 glycosylhydrolase [Polyangiaceae bacterium]|nr:family 16 glycosylhydrolase [Polyangiaceae bacterium]
MKTAHLTVSAAILAVTSIPSVAWAVASAELYSTTPYFYGRFEARVRYAAGDGVVSAFFLWKEGSEVSGTFWNELDYEKVGANCELHTNAYYGNPAAVHTKTHTLAGLCSDYHDYRYEWTPTYIAWVVDGQEIRRETGDVATAYAQNATDGMTFHFNLWPGDQSFGGNLDPSILPVYQYISWVQYSSYDNGAFTLQWREDFEGPDLPSGWALGDWGSPKGKSTHNAANVGFVNGIAVLSLTADDATGVPSTVPADGTSTGGTGSGGTSSGGTSSGGAATGGTATGGTSTGGGTAGGTSSGDTGGTAAGGRSSGGDSTGGRAEGGASVGGTATGGGTSSGDTGGRATGGTSSGGANIGGRATGGANAGGLSTGGADAGGATGGSNSGGAAGGSGPGGETSGGVATGGSGDTIGGAMSTSTGGATGGSSEHDSGASGATAQTTDASDNSGCGCRVPSEGDRSGWRSALGLLAIILFLRRRGPVRGHEDVPRARARVP